MPMLFLSYTVVLFLGLAQVGLEKLVCASQALVGKLQSGKLAVSGKELICGGAETLLVLREGIGNLCVSVTHCIQFSLQCLVVIL